MLINVFVTFKNLQKITAESTNYAGHCVKETDVNAKLMSCGLLLYVFVDCLAVW